MVKFGWGPLGLDSLETDVALVAAAREGLGSDIALCVDAGTIYKRDAAAALQRAHAFAPYDLLFLEEPVLQEAISSYAEIVAGSPVRIAGGEGSDTVRMAEVRTPLSSTGGYMPSSQKSATSRNARSHCRRSHCLKCRCFCLWKGFH